MIIAHRAPNVRQRSRCITTYIVRYTCSVWLFVGKTQNPNKHRVSLMITVLFQGVDHIERHSVCKPSDTFFIGCNTCHCNLSGTDYSCTNKPCPLPDDVELFHELKVAFIPANAHSPFPLMALLISSTNSLFLTSLNRGFLPEIEQVFY